MENTISNVRAWRLWKDCRRLAAVAVYEDSATGSRVNDFCHRLFRDLGQTCEIAREMWPLSELRLPQLRAIAADEAAAADLIIVSLHHDEALADEIKCWIDLWFGHKHRRPAVLLALLDPVYQGPSAALRAFLRQVAERGQLEFRVQADESAADR